MTQSESGDLGEGLDHAPAAIAPRRIWLLWDMWRLGLFLLWCGAVIWALILGSIGFHLKAIERSLVVMLGSRHPKIVGVAIAPPWGPAPWFSLSGQSVRKVAAAMLHRRHQCVRYFNLPKVEFVMRLTLADGRMIFMPASISRGKLYLLGYSPDNLSADPRNASVGRWVRLSPLSAAERALIYRVAHLDD